MRDTAQQQLSEATVSTTSDNDQLGILFGGNLLERLGGLSSRELRSMLDAGVTQNLYPLLEHLAVRRSHLSNRRLECCDSRRDEVLGPEVENVHCDDLRVEERRILEAPIQRGGGSRRAVEAEHDLSSGHAVSLRRGEPARPATNVPDHSKAAPMSRRAKIGWFAWMTTCRRARCQRCRDGHGTGQSGDPVDG